MDKDNKLKIICLGDSAVGKSKLVERFLVNGYKPQQQSTYALTLYDYETKINGEKISVDFWDTAGQERFASMHPSYYHSAHACILVFDVTRKITYKNLSNWYKELRKYRPNIPCVLVANKIDANMDATTMKFAFGKKHNLPQYFCSAADGTNVVKLFRDAIRSAYSYKSNPTDFVDQILAELDHIDSSNQKSTPEDHEDEELFKKLNSKE